MSRDPNVFAGPYLDRVAHLRSDDAWLRDAWADRRTVVVPVWHSKSLVSRTESDLVARYCSLSDVQCAPDELLLLGRHDGRTYFAAEVAEPEALQQRTGATFEDLRLAAHALPAQQAGVLAYARAMLHWRRRHRHCGLCGAPAHAEQAGHVMRCTNEACATVHFPRLDPAIIVLVSDGECALLGRQAAWPQGRYSTIAGFVEPGESLEDAVAREVHEETGIRVDAATYHSSQPWPFPSSLMIGFVARAAAGQVPHAADELEDARWFSRADIAAGAVKLPPQQSVSFRLIEDWYDAAAATPLRATPGVGLWSR